MSRELDITEVDTAALVRLAINRTQSPGEMQELLRRVEILYIQNGGKDPFTQHETANPPFAGAHSHVDDITTGPLEALTDEGVKDLIYKLEMEIDRRVGLRVAEKRADAARRGEVSPTMSPLAGYDKATGEDVTHDASPGAYDHNNQWTPVNKADDRHKFASGAMSSGKKPNYQGTMPIYAYQRFSAHRGYGDAKYGEDNYLKGVVDREFILDRINHGIEHLLVLGEQVRKGSVGNAVPGHDDAAAVMCAGMFVMCWQEHNRDKRGQQVVTDAPIPERRTGGQLGRPVDEEPDGPTRR